MADLDETIKALKDGLDFKIYDSTRVLLQVSDVSNALELLKWQAGTIKGLKDSLKETLDVDAKQLNVVHCNECKFAYRKETNLSNSYECRYPFSIIKENHCGDFFCANAEPKAGEHE